ncbi:MAG: hypothetical protein RLZZ511_2392 [Cyanobacteriota bacterium]|jgi:hypothetical protein
MLKIEQFDIKTGQTLTEYDPDQQADVPRFKEVEHSYLEHWLDKHGLKESAQLSVANFYDGVSDRDRERLEFQDQQVLVFTNGKKGYFADPQTANLIVNGSDHLGINPIYAANQDAAHNLVAYGSLVSSDGLASAVRSDVRILVIDDETKDAGGPLVNWEGQPLEPEDVQRIMDKMGDGTMLVSSDLMEQLRVPEDGDKNLSQTVTQFRAATPDFPGIAKGTVGTSGWCEYLGVDAIVSKNDIKGDDGQFSTPGVKELAEFWVNRKSDGEYGLQSVGPQVKGCLPEATIAEFNPEMLRKGKELAAIANDPIALAQKYIEAKELKQQEFGEEGDRADAIASLLKADPNGVLMGFERVNRAMEDFLRNERVDLATNGIEVPSAMAQHHDALKPWEVCNRDLPQGAIVAYYRSPFANVGSAAIGINNPSAMYYADDEAYRKEGVSYLNPWTAKHVAVTDFDKDANGYFVGYVPETDKAGRDLANQLREQLAGTESLSPAEQYEAGRSAIGELIKASELIKPAQYPRAVEEIITLNAPENKPPDIIKAKKVKHSWAVCQESASAATWRAWEITANNPTGRVANAAMNLRSLAMETQYIPDEQAAGLFKQVATHYEGLMKSHAAGKLVIPTDQELAARGYQAYGFVGRIDAIAQAGQELAGITDPTERLTFSREQLGQVGKLLNDFVDGPQAENLQAAVDVAKSQRGIDEDVQKLAKALAYKEHDLRKHLKDKTIYTNGKAMPTNTQEPIGWGVEQANAIYDSSRLMENPHRVYYNLMPNIATHEQREEARRIGDGFNALQKQGINEKNVDKRDRANQQPTVTFTSKNNIQVTIQRTLDVKDQERSPLWEVQSGSNPDWLITIERNTDRNQRNPEPYKAFLQVEGDRQRWPIGYIAEEKGESLPIADQMKQRQGFSFNPEMVELHPPLVEQPPSAQSFAKAREFLADQVEALPPEDKTVIAGYLWHQAKYNSAAIAGFRDEITTAIEAGQQPHLKVTGLHHNIDLKTFDTTQQYRIQFQGEIGLVKDTDKDGNPREVPIEKMSAYILTPDGEAQKLGAIPNDSIRLPSGTVVTAEIALRDDTKRAFEFEGRRVEVENVQDYDARHRLFDETPITLQFSPHPNNNYREALGSKKPSLLVQFTEDDQTKTLGTLKLTEAAKVGITPESIVTSPIDNQVQNSGSTRVGTLIVKSVEGRELIQLQSNPDLENSGVNPTRGELRAWFDAVAKTSPEGSADPRLQSITEIGKTLNAAYSAENGFPPPGRVAQIPTPMDYWNAKVTLTVGENNDRLKTIAQAQALTPKKEPALMER